MSRRSEYYLGARRKLYPVGSDCVLYHTYWRGDAVDNSIYGNDGTSFGGSFGENGITHDGTDDIIEVAADASLNWGTGDFTYFMWVKPDSATKQVGRLISADIGGGWTHFPLLGPFTNPQWNAVLYNNAWGAVYTYSDVDDPYNNAWHCIGWVVDRSAGTYFGLNGVYGALNATGAGNGDNVGFQTIGIGGGLPADHTNAPYKGIIGECLMFNVYKIEAEFLAYYNYTKSRYGL